MLNKGDQVEVQGRNFTVENIFTKEWLLQYTSPEAWKNPDYGLLLRDHNDYFWRALVKGSAIDLKFLGTKYCPPAAPTEEQLRSFKERMQKLQQKRKEENEQLKQELGEEYSEIRQTRTKKSVVLTNDVGLPAKVAKRRKTKSKITKRS